MTLWFILCTVSKHSMSLYSMKYTGMSYNNIIKIKIDISPYMESSDHKYIELRVPQEKYYLFPRINIKPLYSADYKELTINGDDQYITDFLYEKINYPVMALNLAYRGRDLLHNHEHDDKMYKFTNLPIQLLSIYHDRGADLWNGPHDILVDVPQINTMTSLNIMAHVKCYVRELNNTQLHYLYCEAVYCDNRFIEEINKIKDLDALNMLSTFNEPMPFPFKDLKVRLLGIDSGAFTDTHLIPKTVECLNIDRYVDVKHLQLRCIVINTNDLNEIRRMLEDLDKSRLVAICLPIVEYEDLMIISDEYYPIKIYANYKYYHKADYANPD